MLLTAVGAGPARAATNYSVVAFNASGTNYLWYYDSAGGHDTHLRMLGGASPAIVIDQGGLVEIAFEAATGYLWVYFPYHSTGNLLKTNLHMMPDTNPAISETDWVAFQGSNGKLWYYKVDGAAYDTGQSMPAGSNPAISADGSTIAYHGPGGDLWYYDIANRAAHSTHLEMANSIFASPAIGFSGGYGQCCLVAFQGHNGHLFTYNTGNNRHVDSGLGMAHDGTPSIAPAFADASLDADVAFEANTGHLWIYNPISNKGTDTRLGMEIAKIPTLSAPSIGFIINSSSVVTGLEVAFRTNAGALWTYQTLSRKAAKTNLGIMQETSPVYSPGAIESAGCAHPEQDGSC